MIMGLLPGDISYNQSLLLFYLSSLLATSMIGYAARNHRLLERRAGLKSGLGTTVLVLLNESGLLHAIVQVSSVIYPYVLRSGSTSDGPKWTSKDTVSIGYAVFQNATQIITATYPPALIVLVSYKFTIADRIQSMESAASNPPSIDRESGGGA
ncbi:hypothetical protein BDV98DRAFT_279214 [Pterulicium gracile]|uniref:Uncharacterized protein n=1 Tax=Pterulicium gracile TaxID=1884261 RepID=A0A5C3QX43_9AGAR|nr:hypothetical protein BDV98DRAFT_279214 [Pterula gracilis]